MKQFKPNCMATVLPTMPYRDSTKTCQLILENFQEAPCVPRLSRSIRMYMDALPCLVIDKEKRSLYCDLSKMEEIEKFYDRFWSDDVDYFAMNPKHASGLYTLVEMIKKKPPDGMRMVHTQMPVPGIVT